MNNLYHLIIVGIVGMLLLAFGLVFFVVMYQRKIIRHQQEIRKMSDRNQLELIQASIRGEEEERMRIAADLHDDVGATLSSLRLFMHALAKEHADSGILMQSRELIDSCILKVRNISHKLQPALLTQLGLQASLESFADMISKPGNTSLRYLNKQTLPRFGDNIELSVYRIVQELISNVIRHAGATRIEMETILSDGSLNIEITHDGIGMTDEVFRQQIYKKGSIGLKNIVNRLKTINATITFRELHQGMYWIGINTPVPV